MKAFTCRACRNTGWAKFKQTIGGREVDVAAACRCPKGDVLADPPTTGPHGKPLKHRPQPVPRVDMENYRRLLDA